MSADRDLDDDETRDNIERVARAFFDSARKGGNHDLTLDDARRRVVRARARGDRIREAGNR